MLGEGGEDTTVLVTTPVYAPNIMWHDSVLYIPSFGYAPVDTSTGNFVFIFFPSACGIRPSSTNASEVDLPTYLASVLPAVLQSIVFSDSVIYSLDISCTIRVTLGFEQCA